MLLGNTSTNVPETVTCDQKTVTTEISRLMKMHVYVCVCVSKEYTLST